MLPGCDIERIRHSCPASLARRGCRSLMRMPGTVVAIGWYGPRIPSGAIGFRSHVSRWLGPPHSRMKMHDFSRAPVDAAPIPPRASKTPGRPSCNMPRPPACSKLRRDMALTDGWRLAFAKVLMAVPPEGRAAGKNYLAVQTRRQTY